MKREDITALFKDATAEQIDKLMSINGADINNARKDYDTVQANLATANTELETLKKAQAGIEEERKNYETVKNELDTLKASNALREMRERVSKETGVPASLLTAESEEECKKLALSIKEFAKPSKYPRVEDGGEVGGHGGKQSTREQFEEWFDKVSE